MAINQCRTSPMPICPLPPVQFKILCTSLNCKHRLTGSDRLGVVEVSYSGGLNGSKSFQIHQFLLQSMILRSGVEDFPVGASVEAFGLSKAELNGLRGKALLGGQWLCSIHTYIYIYICTHLDHEDSFIIDYIYDM